MQYTYKAKAGPADLREGIIEAEDFKAAAAKITRMGFVPLDLAVRAAPAARPIPVWKFSFGKTRRVRAGDRINFLRQLHSLIDADVPLLRSMHLVAQQTKNPYLKEIVQQMARSVADGASLSLALSSYPAIFPYYLVAMVRSGEATGQLKTVLGRLVRFAQKQQEIGGKITSSLVYPSFILCLGCLTVFVLLTFVVPRMLDTFKDFGQELPAATRALIGLSNLFSRYWWLLAAGIIAGVIWFKRSVAVPEGKLRLDTFLLKLPFWGTFTLHRDLERLARTMGILLGSGVDMVSALACAQEVIGNEAVKTQVRKVTQEVGQGASFAASLSGRMFVTADIASIVQVGEETGRLEPALLKLADQMEQEAEQLIKTSTTLIEPVLILGVGLVVAFMVIALMLPIMDMSFIKS